MEIDKIFKNILFILFLIFIVLYISSQAGIIDYQARNKTLLTEAAIKEFENDIKNGKDINIKKYIENNNDKYNNELSKATLKVSNSIGNGIDGILKFFFKKLEKSLNN